MGHNKSFSQDDDFEFDEAYFRKFYKPLSNLPTPPPSSRNSSATQSPRVGAGNVEVRNEEFLAPAVYLTRMIPPGLSIESPSVATVQTMLSHAELPMDTIALAACVLDALPTKFRTKWRMLYPRSRHTSPASKRHTLSGPIQQSGNETILPEVVILSALVIATKFLEDLQDTTYYFASVWGRDIWSCEQLNVTERCIMEELGYRIFPLTGEEYIKQARHDMELIRRELLDETSEAAIEAREYELYSTGPDVMARAPIGLGFPPTPAETPKSELLSPFDNEQENSEAFQQHYSHLSTQTMF
ncbi:hypothetical protein BX600DRAFT_25163 [Xylariales sp. PMI_506]|nr:hypothetical protein BX600DRAFT_25163 [Xylariales sp. PMI_506]